MRRAMVVGLACIAAACAPCSAATLPIYTSGNAFVLFLNGGANNGGFDTIVMKVTAPPSTFQNIISGLNAGVPIPPGAQASYFNRSIDQDPLDGGMGWVVLGVTRTSSLFEFTTGPLGQTISTAGKPGGNLFLANLLLPPGGTFTANAQLIRAGNLVQSITYVLPLTPQLPELPEPCSAALGSLGIVGLIATGRRYGSAARWSQRRLN